MVHKEDHFLVTQSIFWQFCPTTTHKFNFYPNPDLKSLSNPNPKQKFEFYANPD